MNLVCKIKLRNQYFAEVDYVYGNWSINYKINVVAEVVAQLIGLKCL